MLHSTVAGGGGKAGSEGGKERRLVYWGPSQVKSGRDKYSFHCHHSANQHTTIDRTNQSDLVVKTCDLW